MHPQHGKAATHDVSKRPEPPTSHKKAQHDVKKLSSEAMMVSHGEMEEVKVTPSILARMRFTGNKENVPDMVYVMKDRKPEMN